jgi:hypothetical protein
MRWIALLALLGCKPHAAAELELPKSVGPPFGLDKLTGGMTADQAKAAVHGLADSKGALVVGDDKTFGRVLLDRGRVGEVYVHLASCGGVEARLERAWGKPERVGDGSLVWSSHATRWSVALDEPKCEFEFVHDALFGKPVTPPPPLDGLRPGVPAKEPRDLTTAPGMWHAKPFADGDTLGMETTIVAGRALVSAWGAGTTIDGPSGKRTYWFDHDAGLRAALWDTAGGTQVHLEFDAYLPFDRWLAKLPDPMLGVKPTDLILSMPPTEYDARSHNEVKLEVGPDGMIGRATMTFPFDSRATHDAMMVVLSHRWGAPKQVGAATELEGSAHMRVRLTEDRSVLTVALERK